MSAEIQHQLELAESHITYAARMLQTREAHARHYGEITGRYATKSRCCTARNNNPRRIESMPSKDTSKLLTCCDQREDAPPSNPGGTT